MKRRSLQQYEARARVARALAHPTRQLLLDALHEREMCVGDLTALVGADQSTVSKHLAVLKNVGLVVGRKEGSMTYYRVKCKCIDAFFGCIESVLKENLEAQRAAVGR